MSLKLVAVVALLLAASLAPLALAQEDAAAAPQVEGVAVEEAGEELGEPIRVEDVELNEGEVTDETREQMLASMSPEDRERLLEQQKRFQEIMEHGTEEEKQALIQMMQQQQAAAQQQQQDAAGPRAYASPDARVAFHFSEASNTTFYIGKPVELMIAFSNVGRRPFLVQGIIASLYHPQDFSYQLLNLTRLHVNLTVPAGEDVSIAYSFTPDPLLEPRPFGFVAQLFYRTEMGNFTEIIFNNTVNFEEVPSNWDTASVFGTLAAIAVLALVGFGGSRVFNRLRKAPKKETGSKGKSAAKGAEEENEWLAGTHAYTGQARPRRK